MKKIILITLFVVNGFVLFGQNEQQKEAQVREMELVEAKALVQQNISTLQKIWSPGFMVNSPLNIVFIGGQVELVKAGILQYTSFTRVVEHVLVLKDVVITMGNETVVPAGLDPLAGKTIYRRFTNIWMKEKGKWVLMARHANNICPTDPSSVSMPQSFIESTVNSSIVRVRNNPSGNHFNLDLVNYSDQKTDIRTFDNSGRIIESLQLANGIQTISIGGNYRSGIYFTEITRGVDKQTLKLIKL